MSLTRALMERLREHLGEGSPLPEPAPIPVIPSPPNRVFPSRNTRSRFAAEAAEHTTALVGIGQVGSRYATDVVLQFQAELAVAHEAVAAVLPEGWAKAHGLLPLRTRARTHQEFLLRPDLARRLEDSSRELLHARAEKDIDIQPILADGLSAVACMGSGMELLEHLTKACAARGWSLGTPLCARFARVWLEDDIGEAVRAKVAIILLGERPGLGTGDGLSAYMVFEPKVGKTDSDRNMISNIHRRGMPPAQAGPCLALLAGAMLDQRRSGVGLDLASIREELGEAAGRGYRKPQSRVRLVQVTP